MPVSSANRRHAASSSAKSQAAKAQWGRSGAVVAGGAGRWEAQRIFFPGLVVGAYFSKIILKAKDLWGQNIALSRSSFHLLIHLFPLLLDIRHFDVLYYLGHMFRPLDFSYVIHVDLIIGSRCLIPASHLVLLGRYNRSLGEGIKARLDERSKDWIGELSHVLWAHRTMIKSSNGETPFSLTYGTEAVIPAEIGMPTLRTAELDLAKNDEALEINLDLIEEKREQAAIQEAKSKAKIEKYYNSKVRSTSFRPGEMVYRSNDASHAKDGGKLGPKWEGPYEVTESLGKGAYKLKDQKGNELPRTWNICNLKKCYIHEV
ncbi:reverse transcriptase domain-containing protein [Tanacetum coccineum]